MDDLKHCWRCQDSHPRSAFAKDANRGDGLRAACRESTNAAARKPSQPNLRPFPERQWRPVPEYEGLYDASDKGDIWSLPRNGKAGRLLRQHRHRQGYLTVALCRNGSQKTVMVHQVMMLAFAGQPGPGQEVRHLDSNPANNRWAPGNTEEEVRAAGGNLYYGTQFENEQDKIGHGTAPRGEQNGRHKLTTEDVREIHRRRRGGESKRSLSRGFGVAPPMIRRILAGTAWQDVAREFPLAAEAVTA